jgi:hypothetical protein
MRAACLPGRPSTALQYKADAFAPPLPHAGVSGEQAPGDGRPEDDGEEDGASIDDAGEEHPDEPQEESVDAHTSTWTFRTGTRIAPGGDRMRSARLWCWAKATADLCISWLGNGRPVHKIVRPAPKEAHLRPTGQEEFGSLTSSDASVAASTAFVNFPPATIPLQEVPG